MHRVVNDALNLGGASARLIGARGGCSGGAAQRRRGSGFNLLGAGSGPAW